MNDVFMLFITSHSHSLLLECVRRRALAAAVPTREGQWLGGGLQERRAGRWPAALCRGLVAESVPIVSSLWSLCLVQVNVGCLLRPFVCSSLHLLLPPVPQLSCPLPSCRAPPGLVD